MKKSIVLFSLLLGSKFAFAQASTADIVNAIDTLNSNVLAQNAASSADATRKQLGTALINYDAAARMQEFQLNQELLFMAAPGSEWAIAAGAAVGSAQLGTIATSLYTSNFLRSTAIYSIANNATYNGITVAPANLPANPTQIYQALKQFFIGGDSSHLSMIDTGQLTNSNRIDTQTAQNIINMLATPFPNPDPTILSVLKGIPGGGSDLSGAQQEALGTAMVEEAVNAMSTSALSTIAARRILTGSASNTFMETVDQYSKERFFNATWPSAMSAASEPAMIREMAHMMAYEIWLQYEQFRISEQQLALLATMNIVLSKINVAIDNLNTQMENAAAQAAAAQVPPAPKS